MLKKIGTALSNPAWVCFLWIGMSVGVAIIETPARFATATVTRPIALDIGRNVFAALNKAELIALVILLIIVRVSGRARLYWRLCGAITLIVIAQSAWLTPELALRAQIIIDGGVPPASYTHAMYSTLELVKYALLFTVGVNALSTERR